MTIRSIAFASFFALLTACSDDMSISDYAYGYGDGNSVGYNVVCNHAIQPIKADWGNEKYAKGYADGIFDGVKEGIEVCTIRDR